MSRDIKEFISGFSTGAGVGLGLRNQRMKEDQFERSQTAGQYEDGQLRRKLETFDRANGRFVEPRGGRGLLRRAAGWVGDQFSGGAPAAVTLPGTTVAPPRVPAMGAVDTGEGWGSPEDIAMYEDGGIVTGDGSTPEPTLEDRRNEPVYSAPMTLAEDRIPTREAMIRLS